MAKDKRKDNQRNHYKQICGGLEIVNPLSNYPEDIIYKHLLASKLSIKNAVGVAKTILDDLMNEPITTPEFVRKFYHVNQIEWAQVKSDAFEHSSKDSTIKYFNFKKGYHYIKIDVDKKFVEVNKLRKDCEVMVLPMVHLGGWSTDTESYRGFVDYIDERDYIIVRFLPSKIYPPEHMDASKSYQVIAVPIQLVFNTRCRTLDIMKSFPGNWSECIFPTRRNELTKQLKTSLEAFEYLEKEFISSTTFSPYREFNQKQKIAIHAIVSGCHEKIPYILFGPPGTGKTVTLVESVRLICENDPMAKILVCTPSNTAADAFMIELMSTKAFRSGSLLRIFALSKIINEQNCKLFNPEHDVLCINDTENGKKFGIPPKDELIYKKCVLVCTLNTSTYLVSGGLTDCFSHIIIDEAGQADELESLIPIVGLISYFNKKTRIIFAGDPKQLGPVQMCDPLKKLSKSTALIERLIDCNDEKSLAFDFDKRVTTMLEDNYRSHPIFLTLPSQLFYGGKLRPCAPIKTKNSLIKWDYLPNKNNFPLLWHTIDTAIEQRDSENKSYQNEMECNVVYNYVNKLILEAKVLPKDIGIITPYRYQIKLLRNRFGKTHSQMLIDSVERFQGCERRVIIISTVRSSGIGFLDCQKRFNTAITRPMELLIIVGDCNNMAKVSCWKKLINFCDENNALININSSSLTLPPQMPSISQQNNNNNNKIIQKKKQQPKLIKHNNSNIVEEIITTKTRKNNKKYKKEMDRFKLLKEGNNNEDEEDDVDDYEDYYMKQKEEQNKDKDETETNSTSTSVESLMERLANIELLVLKYRCDEYENENKNN